METDPALAGSTWQLPPAITLRRGRHFAVIERPGRLLSGDTAQTRLQAVRARYGEHTAHWWFFDRGDHHAFDYAGNLKVRVSGEPTVHDKIRPTSVQRLINSTGAQVCWLSGEKILIPYGGRPITHPVHEGEDWTGDTARWARDWTVSHPHPAPDSAWWGLIPLPVTVLAQPAFRPVPALRIMAALAASQRRREEHRRNLARTAHNHRNSTLAAATGVQLTLDTGLAPTPTEEATSLVTAASPPPLPTNEPDCPAEPLTRVPSLRTRPRWSWRRLLPRRWR